MSDDLLVRVVRQVDDKVIAGPAPWSEVRDYMDHVGKVEVHLFKDSGKWYTEEFWRIPDGAIGPHDMERSPDFHRIGGGKVLIPSQEPWGFPCLL